MEGFPVLHFGIDLDNTIIDYTQAFADAARAFGIESANVLDGRTGLRDSVRAMSGEDVWQKMQAHAYGAGIGYAQPFAGVEAFFRAASAANVPITIVSHKTEFASMAPAGPNLRTAAAQWLEQRGFTIDTQRAVYFESTRAEKCARIAALGVTHFIDDLIEVFDDPSFPPNVQRWLFAPAGTSAGAHADRVFGDWDAMRMAAWS